MVLNKQKFGLLFNDKSFNIVSVSKTGCLNSPCAFSSSDAYMLTKDSLSGLHFDFDSLRNKKILIKPNSGRLVGPHTGINVSPDVVAGVIDFFLENEIKNIKIGESPILGVNALECLEKCGISAVARERGIELIDLDVRKPVITKIPSPKVIKSLKVCADVPEFDFVVSVPVMKTHMHTQVSLGLKNMKGCLYRREKVNLHQLPPMKELVPPVKPLDMAIADLSKILLPDLTVVDGTICQEGLGPSAGSIKNFGVVVSSFNCIAADWVSCKLMGIDPITVHHIRLAITELLEGDEARGDYILSGNYENKNAPEILKKKINAVPANYLNWAVSFEPPPKKISFEYSNVCVEDIDSCSACLSSVMMFLKRYQDNLADYYTEDNPLHIALGKGIGEQKDGTLLVGNCTAHRKKNCVLVKGCPPVASEILKAMEKNAEK